MTRSTLLKTTLIGLAAGLSVSAIAQESFIEEIVVTAQKREQNMQDVPVAVTAFNAQLLQDSGIKDMSELAAVAPSLNSFQSQNSTTSSFSIRGIGTSSQNFGLESSVGLYIDGVYRARQSSIINNLVDIAAIEVLRGPQGTLFGKNTPSGAISMTTVRPTHDRNAFFEVTAGDLGLINLSAGSNLSLIEDVLALRATLYSGTRDGYVSDVRFGDDAINDRNRAGGRLQLAYTPNDRFDARIIADYSEINETCCAALTRQSNLVAFANDDGAGGPLFGSDALLTVLGGTIFTGAQYGDMTGALNRLPHSSNNDRGLSVEMNYDFENVTLTSISAWRKFDSYDNIDADFSDVEILLDTNNATSDTFSQELRLSGEFGEKTTYVAGLYYFTQDLRNISTLDLEASTNTFLTADPTLTALINGINAISAATMGALPTAASAFPGSAYATDDMTQDQESFAIFAQADFEMTDDLVLTAGLRYTDETKKLDGKFLNSPLGPAPDVVAIITNLTLAGAGMAFDPSAFAPLYVPGWGMYFQPALGPQAGIQETLKDDQVTGTLKLSWFANDTTMYYASLGTGYKSGGTNTDRINPIFDQTFGPETSTSLEVGMKADFPAQNVRLNVAVHKTDVDDLQANSFTGNGFNLQNAGSAKTHGAEVELWWTPTATFNMQASYAWTIADFDEFRAGSCWRATPFHTGQIDPGFDTSQGAFSPTASVCDRSGDRVPGNSEHNLFLSATKEFAVNDDITAFVRGEYTYISDQMTDGNNDPLKLRDSLGLANFRAGMYFAESDAELSFWVRNVTEEEVFQTVFDVPVQDGKLMAYPGEPRTWGVTFRKHFQ